MNDQIIMKDIPGYEGRYMATTDGRIWSVKRKIFLKPGTICRGKYKQLIVVLNSHSIKIVSRLIATTFIPNPENKPEVDHINRDSTDNRVQNLRWATHEENLKNSDYMKGLKNKAQLRCKTIACCNKDTNEILWVFKSACQAAELLFNNWNKNRPIAACARGKKKSAYGFYWKYVDTEPYQGFNKNKKKEILNLISAK